MAEQQRKQRSSDREGDTSDRVETDAAGNSEAIAERIDDLLEEIDSVLEENAEEFVKNYVQKGGQ
jgi:prokaryotic ubiquitin-like protein Pup